MVNAQEYINQKYSNKEERKRVIELDISNQNLEGKLNVLDFVNLQELNCSNNQLTELNVVNCPNLEMLVCCSNYLTKLDLSNNLKLEMLNIGDNNFSEQDLSFLKHLVDLEIIVVGNKNREKIKKGIYNRFTGSLESLENMNKLECLDIRNTDISDGLEHLPESLEEFVCSTKERPNSKVKKIYDLFADGKGSAEIDDYGVIKNFREKVKKIKKDNLERIKGEKREKIDQILKQRKESNKNMVNWKDININFTEELQKEWEEKGFTYEQAKEWIDIGLTINDAEYIFWLIGIKEVDTDWLLNHGNDEELREEYKKFLESQTSIEQDVRKLNQRKESKKESGRVHEVYILNYDELIFIDEPLGSTPWEEEKWYAKRVVSYELSPQGEIENLTVTQPPAYYETLKEAKVVAEQEQQEKGFINSEEGKVMQEKAKKFIGYGCEYTEIDNELPGLSNNEKEHISIQEWLNNQYPTLENKRETKEIVFDKPWELKGGELDLSEYHNLERLQIWGEDLKSPLTKIKLGKKPKLTLLSCPKNQLTSLNLTNCPNLEKISCWENKLVELDTSNCLELKELDCSKNKLVNLQLPKKHFLNLLKKSPKLEKLDCSENELTILDLNNCLNLKKFTCDNNWFTKLNLSNLFQLESFLCHNNYLTSTNFLKTIPHPEKLTNLIVMSNNFAEQDLSIFSKFTNLQKLLIGNSILDKIEKGIYNRWTGSLEPLRNLKQLKILDLDNTDITGRLEHLPHSVGTIYCFGKERPESKVKELEEQLKTSPFFEFERGEIVDKYINNWKTIDEHFNSQKRKEWEDKGFDYWETKEWINAGLQADDADYACWLSVIKEKDNEWTANQVQLKEEYEKHLIAVEKGTQLSAEVIKKIKLLKLFNRDLFGCLILSPEQQLIIDKLILNERLKERYIRYGLCLECQQPSTGRVYEVKWCQSCNSQHFQDEFKNWTSGNPDIDKFIQKYQLEATSPQQVLEWIPYEKFTNIKYLAEGGFGKVYKAKWADKGPIACWDITSKKWTRVERIGPLEKLTNVALKTLNSSQNITTDFLQEITHHKLFSKDLLNIVHCYGISQDPETKDYLMVTAYIKDGNLRDYLRNNHLSFKDKILLLESITWGMNLIHKQGLIHKDLHPGNILSLKAPNNKTLCYIADLGLCRPTNEENKSKIYGVLPYVAPEVLQGNPYTQKSDIYSFGMVAYEVMSGLPPYHEYAYDSNLALRICQGLRPNLDDGIAPQLIKTFIEKCWETNPSQRPNLSENNLKNLFAGQAEYREKGLVIVEGTEFDWFNKASLKEKRLPKYGKHPQTFYTNQLINTKQVAQLFQESEQQALEQELKKIEKEINQPLTDELKELVSNFIQTGKKMMKDRKDKEIREEIKELDKKLQEKDITKEKIQTIISYCKRFIESEQQLEQEQLQANIEIPTNNK